MHSADEKFMFRAIELAKLGRPTCSPNPMVGCVIVRQNQIIGEGWHKKAGEPHAEVNAINAVENPNELSEATAYVTLEPCAHVGKTPPCADLLIQKGLKKVVIGCTDPNPLVASKGIKKLEDAGIEVVVGFLKAECVSLNEIFFHSIQHHRPYVVLKWAQTADNFVARTNYDSKWISNEQSRQLVHKWRSELDAILVGKNTVLYDNPSLTTREWAGKNPLRVVIDHKLALDSSFKLFDCSTTTLIYNELKSERQKGLEYIKITGAHFLENLLDKFTQ